MKKERKEEEEEREGDRGARRGGKEKKEKNEKEDKKGRERVGGIRKEAGGQTGISCSIFWGCGLAGMSQNRGFLSFLS